jgi:hypothetical protein
MRVNNIQSIFTLILAYFAVVSTKVFAQSRRSFVVVHSDSVDPYSVVSIADAHPQILMRVKKLSFSVADLSQDEIQKVQVKLKSTKGVLAPNSPIAYDDIVSTNSFESSTVAIMKKNAKLLDSAFLDSTPQCIEPLNGVDFVIIDTVPYTNVSENNNANIILGPNFVNNTTACNPHSSQVISLLAGKNLGVIPNGDRRIYVIAAFDCKGYALPANIILASREALKFAGQNLKVGRKTVVLFSGVLGMNAAVDVTAAALVTAGVPTFIAAGNSGVNACSLNLPPIINNIFTVGSTMSPGNIPAPFTNFGTPCVDLYLPGNNLKVVNVTGNKPQDVSGTTYSTIIAAALGGIEIGMSPTISAMDIARLLTGQPRTAIITPPTDSFLKQPITVMLKQNACPYNRLFNTFNTNVHNMNSFVTWYNISTQDNLCATFKVKGSNSAILIGLRKNAEDLNIVRVVIDKTLRRKHVFTSKITQANVVLDLKNSKKRIIGNDVEKIITIRAVNNSLNVYYDDLANNNPKPLLFANIASSKREIAFSGVHGQVKYANALKCIP